MRQNIARKRPCSAYLWIVAAWGATLLATLAGPASAQAPSLTAQMPKQLFKQAGLDRLSRAELAVLDAWLQSRAESVDATDEQPQAISEPKARSSAATARNPKLGAEQLAQVTEPAGNRIQARIKGAFKGWSGKTVFLLDNGQVWRQRIGGQYRFNAQSPAVEVFKGRFGYYLKVLETGRQVGVRRQK